jgi:hypothetical protein
MLIEWQPDIKDRYAPAFKQLRRGLKSLTPESLMELELMLVRECEEARGVKKDAYAEKRSSDRDAAASSSGASNAAKMLARYLRAHKDQTAWVYMAVALGLRRKGLDLILRPREHVAMSGSEGLALLMDQIAESVVRHNPAGRGPFLHRFSVPGALFERPIDIKRQKRLVARDTVLGFHLVFWLRALTDPSATRPCDGAPMPRVGKPHYEIAQVFVDCALERKSPDDPRWLADRLRKVQGMQYLSWEKT